MATIDLGNLSATQGVKFVGASAVDNLGYNVRGPVGDFNGDGVADLLLAADNADTGTGTTYVVFGATAGLATDLASLADGGVVIHGIDQGDYAGKPAIGLGDVNGDGIPDLGIGAITAGGNYDGEAYVVYGGTSLAADIMLADLTGDSGRIIPGGADHDYAGQIAPAGDFNGDGVADFAIGSYYSDQAGANAGAVAVIFGSDDGLPATIDLDALGADGVEITGASAGDGAGFAVAGGGDVNGDGLGDLAIGTRAADTVFVVFGRDGASADIDLGGLGDGGFTITAAYAGDLNLAAVSVVRDVNGDGFDDVVIGTGSRSDVVTDHGAVYVIFGSDSPADVDLGNLGDAGIRIDPAADGDRIGAFSAAGVNGDFNGDGFNDIVFGSGSGKAYIVFGGPTLASFDLGSLTDAQGIMLQAEASDDGLGLSASGAGDVNGDGLADVRVGTPFNDEGGTNAGAEYLLYGTFSASSTTGDDTLTGAGLADDIDGGDGNDSMSGNGGNDTLTGGNGDDSIDGGAGDDSLSGDAGSDSLTGGAGADTASGGDGNDTVFADDDLLAAGADNDMVVGGAGADSMFGQDGTDTMMGGDGGDSLRGNIGDDMLMGEGDNDDARGQFGNDTIDGGAGDDSGFGGADNDSLDGGIGADQMNGNSGADTVNGGDGDDTVRGQGGNDVVNGNAGNDVVLGMAGFDSLFGGAGDDTLTGGVGNDQATGGDGADVFQFAAFHGADTVVDFEDGSDLMSFVGASVLGDLVIVDGSNGAEITLASEGDSPTLRVTLTGITADQLDASDFIFS